MAPFNPTRFWMPPNIEGVHQEQDPYETFSSRRRIVSELGFVSAIFAGLYLERNGISQEITEELSIGSDLAQVAVFIAGVVGFGFRYLYNNSFLAPGDPDYLRPPPQRRRRRQPRR